LYKFAKVQLRGRYGEKVNRHPQWWRRRRRPQLGHKNRHLQQQVVGLRRGWEALTHLNPEDPNSRRRYVMALGRENTRTIDRRGGGSGQCDRNQP